MKDFRKTIRENRDMGLSDIPGAEILGSMEGSIEAIASDQDSLVLHFYIKCAMSDLQKGIVKEIERQVAEQMKDAANRYFQAIIRDELKNQPTESEEE